MRYLVKWQIRDPIAKYHIELHVHLLQIDMEIAKKGDGELDTVLIPNCFLILYPKVHPKSPKGAPKLS